MKNSGFNTHRHTHKWLSQNWNKNGNRFIELEVYVIEPHQCFDKTALY